MTMIINHAKPVTAPGAWGLVSTVAKAVSAYAEQKRAERQTRREHAMLMAMSKHDLHDIGLVASDVAFGISSGRGVFRDADRPAN